MIGFNPKLHGFGLEGRQHGSFIPVIENKDQKHQLFAIWTYGVVEIYFQWYSRKPPFAQISKRNELAKRLMRIPGVKITEEMLKKRPSIDLQLLQEPTSLNIFLEAFDWVITEINRSLNIK